MKGENAYLDKRPLYSEYTFARTFLVSSQLDLLATIIALIREQN